MKRSKRAGDPGPIKGWKAEQARRAIEELFGDTSVPLSQTLADLEELRDDLELKIDAMRSDARRAENGS